MAYSFRRPNQESVMSGNMLRTGYPKTEFSTLDSGRLRLIRAHRVCAHGSFDGFEIEDFKIVKSLTMLN
jgi:hypothetical protein